MKKIKKLKTAKESNELGESLGTKNGQFRCKINEIVDTINEIVDYINKKDSVVNVTEAYTEAIKENVDNLIYMNKTLNSKKHLKNK